MELTILGIFTAMIVCCIINLRRMFRTCLVPFVITSLTYGIIGYFITIQGEPIYRWAEEWSRR